MSISVASINHDLAIEANRLVKASAANERPVAAAMPTPIFVQGESIAKTGEDISSLLVLIPVGLLALVTFGAMLTPF